LVRVNSTTDALFLFVSLIEVFIRPANNSALDVIVKVELLEIDCFAVSENCNNKLFASSWSGKSQGSATT
jgi:hypothetical protein